MNASPSHACSFGKVAFTAHDKRMSTELVRCRRATMIKLGAASRIYERHFDLVWLARSRQSPPSRWDPSRFNSLAIPGRSPSGPGSFIAVRVTGFPPRRNGPGSCHRVSIPFAREKKFMICTTLWESSCLTQNTSAISTTYRPDCLRSFSRQANNFDTNFSCSQRKH
jgi:hypothetical protein